MFWKLNLDKLKLIMMFAVNFGMTLLSPAFFLAYNQKQKRFSL